MKSLDENFILEPMRYLLSEGLLNGFSDTKTIDLVEIIKDKNLALDLSRNQSLPKGYMVWQDVIDNAVGKFRLDKKFHEAEQFLASADDDFASHQSKLSLRYRKSKLKKENTEYDDFLFSVLDEVYYQLKMLSLQRYINGYDENSLLERIFALYLAGLYPCGMKKNKIIVAYNPINL